MRSENAIEVQNLSKVFTLRQARVDENGVASNEHWALKDVSFEIKKGESVGIIGPNGSGKSTLLQILAGVTKPTSGKVSIRGKVASILDIGAGFHPELSGRENVFLNGQIHGFAKKEIEAKFDEIVEFSGIEKFIDEPVKNYSNGMYLRLAFSIMANLDFDVYLLDEVLSVGDAEFGYKIHGKLESLRKSNKTIIAASHNMAELSTSDRYLILEDAKIKYFSKNTNFLLEYMESAFMHNKRFNVRTNTASITDFSEYKESGEVKLKKIDFFQEKNQIEHFKTNKPFKLIIQYEKMNDECTVDPFFHITDLEGTTLLSSAPFITKAFSKNKERGNYTWICEIPAHMFNNQVYRINISFVVANLVDQNILSEKNNIYLDVLFKDILIFKPILENTDLSPSFEGVNFSGKLFMGFNWECNFNEL